MSWIITDPDLKDHKKYYWQGIVPGLLSLCTHWNSDPRQAAHFDTRKDATTAFTAVSQRTDYTLEEVPDQGLTAQKPSHPAKVGQLDLFADSWASI
jgi:hypothetical protein